MLEEKTDTYHPLASLVRDTEFTEAWDFFVCRETTGLFSSRTGAAENGSAVPSGFSDYVTKINRWRIRQLVGRSRGECYRRLFRVTEVAIRRLRENVQMQGNRGPEE